MKGYGEIVLKCTLREKISFEGTIKQYFDSLIDVQIHTGVNSMGNAFFIHETPIAFKR